MVMVDVQILMTMTNMKKEHITKREIFERIRSVREELQNGDMNTLANIVETLLDLETGILQDCRKK